MDDNTRRVLEKFLDVVDRLLSRLVAKIGYLAGAGVAYSAKDAIREAVQAMIEIVRSSQ